MKRVALYCRVSTKDQTTENQVRELREYCKIRNWNIVGEFVDHGISGAKENRPQLDLMMKAARRRYMDVVLVWAFDRFARSLPHLIRALSEFNTAGVDFVSMNDNIDTTSAHGKLHFYMISAFSEFERDMIRARVISGLERAKAAGVTLGRPEISWDVETARKLRAQGLSVRKIAVAMGVPKSRVGRELSQIPR